MKIYDYGYDGVGRLVCDCTDLKDDPSIYAPPDEDEPEYTHCAYCGGKWYLGADGEVCPDCGTPPEGEYPEMCLACGCDFLEWDEESECFLCAECGEAH